jgi:hypothetical protein
LHPAELLSAPERGRTSTMLTPADFQKVEVFAGIDSG